jgi:adenosylhomocysteine nucleosidase
MMALVSRGVTSFCDDDRTLTSGHGAAVCGTGGSFITSTDPWLAENKIDVVDIELFATALACKRFVPWRYAFVRLIPSASAIFTSSASDRASIFLIKFPR